MSGAKDEWSQCKRKKGHLWDVLHCIKTYVVFNNIPPLWCWIHCRKHKNISAFFIISQNLDITGCCNPFPRKTKVHLSCRINTMTAGIQATMLVAIFSKVVATFSRVGHSFTLFKCHHWGCLNNPIFPIWGFVLHIYIFHVSSRIVANSSVSSLLFSW